MKKFWRDCLFCTFFVFVILFSLYSISKLNIFSAFDPLGKALGDMEMSDIAFSRLREDPPIDTNIVIVNIGDLSRGEIGQQIANLNRCKPKVIALDIIFSCDYFQDSTICPQAYDTLNNLIFANAVGSVKSMVMGMRITQTDSLINVLGDAAVYDSIEHTYPTLLQNSQEGFVNLITDADHQEDLKQCRALNPTLMVSGKEQLAFSVKIAMLFDSVRTKKFLARGNEEEVINYRGNIVDWHGASSYAGRYPVLDWEQVLDTSQFMSGMIKDKIVIMGFLGSDLRDTSWDDKFFTPLNKIYAGRARPDMYGIVVHSNAVSMILYEDYVNQLHDWQEFAIAIVIVLLNVALFFSIVRNERSKDWFDGLSLLVQLIQVLLFTSAMIFCFAWFNFKLNITVTLAAVALVGTCFELYTGVFLKSMSALEKRIRTFTTRRKRVLTEN